MFGVGMAVAGGCILGATYRSGEGLVGSMSALVGIAVRGALALNYSLAPLRNQLQAATNVQINGLSPTIPLALGISSWFVIIPAVALVTFFALKTYRTEKKKKANHSLFGASWPWWLTGIIVGAVGVISYPVAEAAGRTTPLAMTGGYVGLLAVLVHQDVQFVGWEQTMVIGGIIGAGVASYFAREWRMRVPQTRMLGQSLLGGLAMGIGAVVGDGCNITTILIGVPLFSLGGILASSFTVLGCCSVAYLMRGEGDK